MSLSGPRGEDLRRPAPRPCDAGYVRPVSPTLRYWSWNLVMGLIGLPFMISVVSLVAMILFAEAGASQLEWAAAVVAALLTAAVRLSPYATLALSPTGLGAGLVAGTDRAHLFPTWRGWSSSRSRASPSVTATELAALQPRSVPAACSSASRFVRGDHQGAPAGVGRFAGHHRTGLREWAPRGGRRPRSAVRPLAAIVAGGTVALSWCCRGSSWLIAKVQYRPAGDRDGRLAGSGPEPVPAVLLGEPAGEVRPPVHRCSWTRTSRWWTVPLPPTRSMPPWGKRSTSRRPGWARKACPSSPGSTCPATTPPAGISV